MNIYQKLSAITADLQTVAKNLTVQQTGSSSYKAVSERDIIDAVKPLEAKYGVYSYPARRSILESNMLESESTYNGNTKKKTTFMTRIETVYRFVNIDAPEEFIETTTFAEGIDPQDKGSGKAMTYADKYALMKAYKISTGDDPDQTASEETLYRKPLTFCCANCGADIKGYKTSKGTVSAEEHIAKSVNRFGKKLCAKCYKEAVAAEREEPEDLRAAAIDLLNERAD